MARERESFTARGVATVRSRLSREATPDGDADAAERFLADVRLPLQLHWNRSLRRYLAVRTAFFDRCLLDAIDAGARQIVIVGAGYDDRALRMRHPGVRFVEIDEPVTQTHKRRRLQRLGLDGYATYVAVDLARESARAAVAEHVAAADPTFVMAEAVFPYVPEAGIRRTLSDLSQITNARAWLAVDLPTNPATWQGRLALAAVRFGAGRGGEKIETVMDATMAKHVVASAGWAITSVQDLGELGVPQLRGASLFVRAARVG